jgi:hypothetical protein
MTIDGVIGDTVDKPNHFRFRRRSGKHGAIGVLG